PGTAPQASLASEGMPMKVLPSLSFLVAIAPMIMQTLPVQGAAFVDVLDTPAQISPLATKSLLQSVTRAGDRLIAVGQRGHIVVSTDNGATWKQAAVPVSSDLNSVFFIDDKQGWVVGHD